jgi:hypothetical protein
MAEPSSGVTVQIVRGPDAGARRATRLGVGLLVSLVVGWPSLGTALAGGDDFEASVVHFLLSVAVSVAGVLALGALYDHFTTAGATPPAKPTPGATDPIRQEERP